MNVLSQLRNLDEDMENIIHLNDIVSNYNKSLNFKNSEDALLCLNSLIENNSDNINILLFRGMIHYSLDSLNNALNDFNRILSINPNNVSALNCHGTTHRKLYQCDKALIDLNKSLEIKPDSAFALAHRGDTYRLLKKYDLALSDLNRSLEMKPSSFAFICRGAIYNRLKKYDLALLDLNRSLEMKPDDIFALYYRGEVYRMLKKHDDALLDFNRSLEIEPDDTYTLIVRGIVYKSLKKYDKALSDFNKSLEINPDDTYALYHRGEVYRMLEKHDDALLDFNRSLEIKPDDVDILTSRGAVYKSLKKYDEALSDFNKSLEINPNDTFALYHRGEIYKILEKYDVALLDFNRSLEIEPDNVFTLRAREEIYQVMRSNLKDIWEENEMDEIIEKIERFGTLGGNYTNSINKLTILIEDEDIMTDKEAKQFNEIRYNLESSSQDEYGYCEECQHLNTGMEWCNSCNAIKFQKEFCNWTSENSDIDNLIQQSQLKANNFQEVIEWIPFNRFKDINYVDRGGFGTVFKAIWIDGYIKQWDNNNNEWIRESETNVVLKHLDNSAHAIEEFLREVKNQYRFRGNWIIAIYGITKDPEKNEYMMVMQYASDGSLRKMLDNRFIKLNWRDKLSILRYISYGLALIHKEGLMHKDFHSKNLVGEPMLDYDTDYITYITDFGLCKPIGVQDSNTYGVLPYIAPEVLKSKDYTQASDIYSFGIVMTEVLTGYPPYHDIPHDFILAIHICQGLRPKIRCEIPQLLLDMIDRCLDAEPSKRPSAKKLYRILQKYSIDYKDHESEFYDQVEQVEISTKEFPIYNPTKLVTHPMAIYTSRPLDYNELPNVDNITRAESNRTYDSLSCYRIPDNNNGNNNNYIGTS